jgi:hypothetical protein
VRWKRQPRPNVKRFALERHGPVVCERIFRIIFMYSLTQRGGTGPSLVFAP